MAKIHQRILPLKLLIICCTLAAGLESCDSGLTSGAASSSTPGSPGLAIANISTIPTNHATTSEFTPLTIANTIAQSVSLQQLQVQVNGQSLSPAATTAYVDASACLTISGNSSCQLKLKTPPSTSGYLLTLRYSDDAGNRYQLNQVVSLSATLPIQNGFIYSANSLNLSSQPGGSLTLPFRLSQDYAKVTALINNHATPVSCNGSNYDHNTLCNVVINQSQLNATDGSNQLQLQGYATANASAPLQNALLNLSLNSQALLTTSSFNAVVNPDNGSNPQTIYLVNNGNGAATNVNVYANYPITIAPTGCAIGNNYVPANGTCALTVNVSNSALSGESTIVATYNNGSNTQSLTTNLNYISPSPAPALTLTNSGSFVNIFYVVATPATSYYSYINVTNTGAVKLTNLQFNNVTLQAATMGMYAAGTTCVSGQSLVVGQSCTMVLSYTPTGTNALATFNFIPSATYSSQAGQALSYYNNTVLQIPYSAATSYPTVAMGDYGVVWTLPVANTAITAQVDSPFPSSGTGAGYGLTNTPAGLYGFKLNTGAVESSTLHGLFWSVGANTAPTNLSATSCNVTTDGTYFYTCGTTSVLNGACASGQYCIMRNNGLTGAWTGVFQPASLPSLIYYFTNGTNNAYVTTLASATANSGLATSSNGSSWSATSSGQGTAANNSFSAATYNATANTITAWDTVGWNSTSNLASVTSAWTANNTNRPGNTSAIVGGAAWGGSTYAVLANTLGIYTSTTSNGAYAQVLNSATAYAKIAYGTPNAVPTWVTIGPSGVNAYSSSATAASWTANPAIQLGDNATLPILNNISFDSLANQFWAVGVNIITKSNDGINWAPPAIMGMTKNSNNGYLAVDNQGYIYASTNLSTWTQQTNPSGNVLNAIYCVGKNQCFAVGQNGTILKSTDGATWQILNSGAGTTNLKAITCNGTQCVVVGGKNTANSGTVLVSSDYTTWTTAVSNLATTDLNASTYAGSYYIAVGNAGSIFYSSNGYTWVAGGTAGASSLNGVACAPATCIAVGNAGAWYAAVGSTSWLATTATNQGTGYLYAIVWNGNEFVAVGSWGYMRWAPLAGNWNAATMPTTSLSGTTFHTVINQ